MRVLALVFLLCVYVCSAHPKPCCEKGVSVPTCALPLDADGCDCSKFYMVAPGGKCLLTADNIVDRPVGHALAEGSSTTSTGTSTNGGGATVPGALPLAGVADAVTGGGDKPNGGGDKPNGGGGNKPNGGGDKPNGGGGDKPNGGGGNKPSSSDVVAPPGGPVVPNTPGADVPLLPTVVDSREVIQADNITIELCGARSHKSCADKCVLAADETNKQKCVPRCKELKSFLFCNLESLHTLVGRCNMYAPSKECMEKDVWAKRTDDDLKAKNSPITGDPQSIGDCPRVVGDQKRCDKSPFCSFDKTTSKCVPYCELLGTEHLCGLYKRCSYARPYALAFWKRCMSPAGYVKAPAQDSTFLGRMFSWWTKK